MNRALWIIQWLLALLFLFAGVMKFVMPVEEMTKQMPTMPGWFLHFIGVAEIVGAIGLVLPGLLRIRPGLTTLAAACLVVIMIGATAITIAIQGAAAAVFPFVVCLLVVFVAYGRWRVALLA
ncbi:MAG: DoxX family protein [Bryobacteraceae bacterium]